MPWVFADFEIDHDGPRLLRNGSEVPLERRTLDLLCYLAEHPGRLVAKDELIAQVWNANALSDSVLSNTVSKLRKALGQGARDREPIETVHGRGYRLHATPRVRSTVDPVAPSVRAEPFVGRQASVAQLELALDEVENGAGRFVLISGEAGIGKSRTLAELASRAATRDFSVWRGDAYAGGAAPAYWPWVEIVRAILVEPEPRRQLPSDAWAIATLVPGLLPQQARTDDAHALRFRLFDELTRWFAAASAERPILLAIDDLQWADVASIELLEHLTRGLRRLRVLLVAAVRDDVAGPLRASTAEAHALRRLFRSAVHIELRGLQLSEVSELVFALAAQEPDARSAQLLHTLTQGNPFFVRQVVQLLAQRQQPLLAANIEAAELPPAVREVIQQRLVALPPETRALLRAASAIGQSFDATLLARATQQPLTAVLPALEPALRLGVLGRHDSRSQRYHFNHALVCDSLYDEASIPQRGQIHALLAHALAEHAPASDPRVLGEVARHSLLAVPVDVEATVRHCCRAAEASREASGFEAAAELLTRALERLAVEGGHGELRCEVLYQVSLDHLCAGEIAQGQRALEDGAQLAAEIGATHWLVRCVSRLAGWVEFGGDALTLKHLVDRALEQVDPAAVLYAPLLARKAELSPELGATGRHRLYDEAERHAAQSGIPELMLEVAFSRANQRDPARLDESRTALAAYRALEAHHPRALLGIQRRTRRSSLEVTAYWCALLEGDRAAAQLALAECQAAAVACRIPYLQRATELMAVTRALSEERLADAWASIERMRESSDLVGGLAMMWQYCTLLHAEATNPAGLFALLYSKPDVTPLDHLPRRRATSAIAWAAALAGRTGHAAAARLLLNRVSDAELERMPSQLGDLGLLCSIAEAYVAIADRSRIDALYLKLQSYASLNAVGSAFEYKGSVAHYLGLLALHSDRPDVAVRHFETAIAFNEKLGMPAQAARSRELLERAAAAC